MPSGGAAVVTRPTGTQRKSSASSTNRILRYKKHKPSSSSSSSSATTSSTMRTWQPYPSSGASVELDLVGDFNGVTETWSTEEVRKGRRLVRFWREPTGEDNEHIRCAFRVEQEPLVEQEAHGYSTVIRTDAIVSCILWQDKYYATSVDAIALLECLLGIRFTIEDKNRVRRNLEAFHPITVSKGKIDTLDFFKHIMGFPPPRPRNIEKDIKVFEWHKLPFAIKKIVVKQLLGRSSQRALRAAPMPASSQEEDDNDDQQHSFQTHP